MKDLFLIFILFRDVKCECLIFLTSFQAMTYANEACKMWSIILYEDGVFYRLSIILQVLFLLNPMNKLMSTLRNETARELLDPFIGKWISFLDM